jgi:hypothetical protein
MGGWVSRRVFYIQDSDDDDEEEEEEAQKTGTNPHSVNYKSY